MRVGGGGSVVEDVSLKKLQAKRRVIQCTDDVYLLVASLLSLWTVSNHRHIQVTVQFDGCHRNLRGLRLKSDMSISISELYSGQDFTRGHPVFIRTTAIRSVNH
jgi:hypothetical protein